MHTNEKVIQKLMIASSSLPQPIESSPPVPASILAIQKVYGQMRKAEKSVAEYILSNPDEVINLSITELAEKVGASESTIVRLAQRAGFKGYQGLRIALASDLVSPASTNYLYSQISPEDDLLTVKRKVFTANIVALTKAMDNIDDGMLEAAVSAIASARKTEIYGLGASAAVAFDAYHKLLKIGIPAVAVLDSNMQVMSASLLTNLDVAIAISHSGALKDTIEVIHTARRAGATTIGITDYEKSPLAQCCEIALVTTTHGSGFQSDIMASRIAQLTVVDTLFVAVALRRFEEVQGNLQKTREATASRRF